MLKTNLNGLYPQLLATIVKYGTLKYMRRTLLLILSLIQINVFGQSIGKILYRGDSILVYPSDSITMVDIKLIDSLPDGKYFGFYKADTAFLRLEINYVNNRIDGKVIEYYYANRDIEKIVNYRNGEKNGYWAEYDTFTDFKEVLHEGYYKNGLEDGFQYSYSGDIGDRTVYSKSFYKNDTLIYNIWKGTDSTFYKNDTGYVYQHDWNRNLVGYGKEFKNKKNGLWKYYYPNGQVKSRGEYKLTRKSVSYIESRKSGKWIDFYPNGQMSREYICDNLKKGSWISTIIAQYDSLGNLLDSNQFVNGIGLFKEFYANGKIMRETLYLPHDFVKSEKYYSDKGLLIYKQEFQPNTMTRTEYYDSGSIKSIERFKYTPSENIIFYRLPPTYYRFGKQEYFNKDGTVLKVEHIKKMQLVE